jgi:hypothetical protein
MILYSIVERLPISTYGTTIERELFAYHSDLSFDVERINACAQTCLTPTHTGCRKVMVSDLSPNEIPNHSRLEQTHCFELYIFATED